MDKTMSKDWLTHHGLFSDDLAKREIKSYFCHASEASAQPKLVKNISFSNGYLAYLCIHTYIHEKNVYWKMRRQTEKSFSL